MYRKNSLKEKLSAGKKCLGCWLFMGSPVVTELLSLTGFDALIIDQEHAPGSLETGTSQLRAASSSPTTMLVRVADNRPMYFKQILDAGAEGVMVANLETAEEAQAAVSASSYPLRGQRGVHRLSRAADWGIRGTDYYETIAENLLIVGLIESVKGVENIADMCRVDGLDMLFIGAVDLSASIGKLAQFDDPEVKELIQEAERRVLEGGKWLGRVAPTVESTVRYFERGYHFVTNASDAVLLREAALRAASVMP